MKVNIIDSSVDMPNFSNAMIGKESKRYKRKEHALKYSESIFPSPYPLAGFKK